MEKIFSIRYQIEILSHVRKYKKNPEIRSHQHIVFTYSFGS